MSESEDNFEKCLKISPNLRSLKDIFTIHSHFKSIEVFRSFKNVTTLEFSKIGRYEYYCAHSTMYRRGQECKSWYIVLSGCVLVGQNIFFPKKSFGQRLQGDLYRSEDCLVLEDTEIIAFDYNSYANTLCGSIRRRKQSDSVFTQKIDNMTQINRTTERTSPNISYTDSECFQESKNSSVLSITSYDNVSFRSDIFDNDSGNEDFALDDDSTVNQALYEAIMKDPNQRSEVDIETIFENINNLSTFVNFTTKTKKELCRFMHLQIVNDSNKKIMSDKSLLDTWNLIIDGVIEVRFKDGSVKEYSRGDSFGVKPNKEIQKQNGDMWTVTQSCLFFCVLQNDFCEIISRNSNTITPETEDNGHIVLVYENREMSSNSTNPKKVIVKGKVEKLINCLFTDQNNADSMYVEDFFLVYRAFINSPKILAEELCRWFECANSTNNTELRTKIIKCILLWTNNHFDDLDNPNTEMSEYLERFDKLFTSGRHLSQDYYLFLMSCSKNSKERLITLDITKHYIKKVPFRLIGLQKDHGLFVKEINCAACKVSGLRICDQIITLAHHDWKTLESLDKVVDMLNSDYTNTVDVIVKYNPLGLQKLLEDLSKFKPGVDYDCPNTDTFSMLFDMLIPNQNRISRKNSKHVRQRSGSVSILGGINRKAKNTMMPMELPPYTIKENCRNANPSPNRSIVRQPKKVSRFQSVSSRVGDNAPPIPHRSISTICSTSINLDDLPKIDNNTVQVLKVWRPNLENKLILITSNTTVKEALLIILKEFAIIKSSSNTFDLFLASVSNEDSKTIISRVPLYLNDLAGRLALNQRYYLKARSEHLQITEEQAKTFLNESKINLSQLSAFEIATRLTLLDYRYFSDIQSLEYLNFILNLKELSEDNSSNSGCNCLTSDKENKGFSTGCENYKKFQDRINIESFWPTNEICLETSVTKRTALIKKFIKVAKICKELKNFNSIMCIMTGLSLTPVSRLKASWEKVPSQYLKIFNELYSLIDMSFNFRQIRQLEFSEVNEPPIIPCIALHTKDLASIHLNSETFTKDGLVNFQKLRIMATEIRKLTTMCNTSYNLETILATVRKHNSPSFFGTYFSVEDADTNSVINGIIKKKNSKRKSSITSPSTKRIKKIYEEWLTTLKVSTYLQNLNVEMKIEHLQDLSFALEPPSTNLNTMSFVSNMSQSESSENTLHKSNVSIFISTPKEFPDESPSNNIDSELLEQQLTKSIFCSINQEDIDKLMERATLKRRSKQESSLTNETTDKHLHPSISNDQHFLGNIPIYQNNKIHQNYRSKHGFEKKTLKVHSHVSDALLEKSIAIRKDNYPVTGVHNNETYYKGSIFPNINSLKNKLPLFESSRPKYQNKPLDRDYRSCGIEKLPMRPNTSQLLSEKELLNQILKSNEIRKTRERQMLNFSFQLPTNSAECSDQIKRNKYK